MLSSFHWCQIYTDKLYIVEGRPITVKMFVGHDMPAAAFKTKECAQIAYELDDGVCVSIIQASKVVKADYLQGSSKTFDDIHWIGHDNTHPRLNKMNVQVKTKKIKDPIEKEGKYNYRNHVYATHILCAKKDEKEVNIQIGNLYNKVKKSSRAAANLLEAQVMRYVPYEATHKIAQTHKCAVQLPANAEMATFATPLHSFSGS